MGFIDTVKLGKAPPPLKVAKPWSVEDQGRTGAKTQINAWVGKETGKDCDGNKWVPEMNDQGKPKRVTTICWTRGDGKFWMKIPYGTQTILEGEINAKNEAEAINQAKLAYKAIDDGEFDQLITTAYKKMRSALAKK